MNKSNNKRSNNKKSNKLSREDSIQTSKDDTFINSTNINEIDSDSSSQNTIPKNKHSNKKSRPKMAADKEQYILKKYNHWCAGPNKGDNLSYVCPLKKDVHLKGRPRTK